MNILFNVNLSCHNSQPNLWIRLVGFSLCPTACSTYLCVHVRSPAFAKWIASNYRLTDVYKEELEPETIVWQPIPSWLARLWISFLRSWKCLSDSHLKISWQRRKQILGLVQVLLILWTYFEVRSFLTQRCCETCRFFLRCHFRNSFFIFASFLYRDIYRKIRLCFLGVLLLLFFIWIILLKIRVISGATTRILAKEIFARAGSTQRAMDPVKHHPVFFLFLEMKNKMMGVFSF